MIVPWVVEGPGIRKGFEITEPNNTVNTASTVLSLFGVGSLYAGQEKCPARYSSTSSGISA